MILAWRKYNEDNTTTIIRHGSPGYAAPEQYGSGTNPRTDIYALGATFYTLLTGSIPIDAIARVTRSKGIDPLVLGAPDRTICVLGASNGYREGNEHQ